MVDIRYKPWTYNLMFRALMHGSGEERTIVSGDRSVKDAKNEDIFVLSRFPGSGSFRPFPFLPEREELAPRTCSGYSFPPGRTGVHAAELSAFFPFREVPVMASVHICYLRDASSVYGGGLCYATPGAAGMDLRACFDEEEVVIRPGERLQVPTGLCVEPCVPDVAGFIYSRSGLGAVKGVVVAQGVGVVDADYRGEIVVWLLNTSDRPVVLERGDRVAQLVFQPVCRPEPVAVDALSETERGDGGFGHTGRS